MKSLTKSENKKINSTISYLEQAQYEFDEMVQKYQEVYDNKSARWQESDAAEQHQELITQLESTRDEIEQVKDSLMNFSED